MGGEQERERERERERAEDTQWYRSIGALTAVRGWAVDARVTVTPPKSALPVTVNDVVVPSDVAQW